MTGEQLKSMSEISAAVGRETYEAQLEPFLDDPEKCRLLATEVGIDEVEQMLADVNASKIRKANIHAFFALACEKAGELEKAQQFGNFVKVYEFEALEDGVAATMFFRRGYHHD